MVVYDSLLLTLYNTQLVKTTGMNNYGIITDHKQALISRDLLRVSGHFLSQDLLLRSAGDEAILQILQAAFQITMVSVKNKAKALGNSRMICGLKSRKKE